MNVKQVNLQLMIISLLIVITTFFLYRRSFNDDVPTCNGYLINVYLYVLMALLIISFSILYIAKRRIPITQTKGLLSFAISLVLLFSMAMISPESVILNHTVWFAFILAMSVGLYTVWRYSSYRGTLTSTLIGVFLIVAGMSVMAYLRPDMISLSWGPILTIILLGFIVAMLVPMFISDGRKMVTYHKFLSAGLIILFSILILYDTKLLQVKAEKCTFPNYPADSLGLFLDVINLFTNVAHFN